MAIQVLSIGAFSVTVPALSVFNDGPDALTIDGKFYNYQSYNRLTGVFSIVTPNPLQEGVSAGMIITNATLKEKRQQEAFDRLRSYFPKRYNINKTTNLKAFLHGLSKGDGYIDYQVEAVRDNLLVMTAQGKYLDRLAGQYGIVRGQGSGVQDSDFRQLIPLLGPSPKQVTEILNKIIDIVY
jgi:hypothetical protein